MTSQKSLADFFLFAGIPDETVAHLLEAVPPTVLHVSAGEILYSGENGEKKLGLLLSGEADVKRRGENEVVFNHLRAGDAFGVASLFGSDGDFPTVIVAKKKAACAFFSEEQVEKLLALSPLVNRNYITFLSEKIRFLNEKIASFSAKNAEGKLASLLLSLEKDGVAAVGSFTGAAKRLSCGRASFYRALAALTKSGAIERHGDQIRILNKEILERIQKQ